MLNIIEQQQQSQGQGTRDLRTDCVIIHHLDEFSYNFRWPDDSHGFVEKVRKKLTKNKTKLTKNGVKVLATKPSQVEFDVLDLPGLPYRRHYHHRVHAHL